MIGFFFNLPLDKISCFPSENFLGGLKRLLRGTRSPLCQLFKRLKEREAVGKSGIHKGKSDFKKKNVIERFKPNVRNDSYCMLVNDDHTVPKIVIRVTSVSDGMLRGIPLIISKIGNEYEEFYSSPVKSSCFNILIAEGQQIRAQSFDIRMFNVLKCIAIPIENDNKMLIMPLLSTV